MTLEKTATNMPWSIPIALGLAFAASATSCKGGADRAAREQVPATTAAAPSPVVPAPEPATEGEFAAEQAAIVDDLARDERTSKLEESDKKLPEGQAGGKKGKANDGKQTATGGNQGAPATRSWFPETFLFKPLVVTDERGVAEVATRVPDRLTTWRVLGLAHSRDGAQAGTVASFLGTLPTYVEPIVPPFLRTGDVARVAVQAVNTTDAAVNAALAIQVDGASLVGQAQGNIAIAAQSSALRYATVRADRAGTARFRARLGGADAVARTIEILPTGQPVSETRSATLAAGRKFRIATIPGANPRLQHVRLQVFAGALALLRSELTASLERGGLAEDAFTLLLSGTAPALLQALGDKPDEAALRAMRIVAAQRAVRYARVLDMTSATLLARAALAHREDPVLARLGQRAVEHLARNQAPDGTCGGETGWSLQRLLVATADCARAAIESRDVVVRASGAFERHADQVRDPYTAAAILASGAAPSDLAALLRERVVAALAERDNGARVLPVPNGMVRADGVAPSEVDATALAILALRGQSDVPLADLGATLLASYSPEFGWGDGRTNLVAMEAVLDLFKNPLPDSIAITLRVDGQMVSQGTLTRERVREVLVLDASALDNRALAAAAAKPGEHEWHVEASPAVPGLGFSLVVTNRVPWQEPSTASGLELAIAAPGAARARVGQAAELLVRAALPSGRVWKITIELPAGMQVDTNSLDPLVQENTIARYQTPDGAVVLYGNPLPPAQAFAATIRVIPTLAGTLQSGPAFLELPGSPGDVAVRIHDLPTRWTIQ